MPGELEKKNLVVITDLDGTMLDQQTYSYEQSLAAIERLRDLDIPLVLCSSKTAAEIIPLQQEIGLKEPFICESGGALYLPRNYWPFAIAKLKHRRLSDVIEFGKRIFYLRQALQSAALDCGATVKHFGNMSFQEIMSRTGLTLEQAIHARQREYDEPFWIESGDAAALCAALHGRGLTVTKGDRFYHLTGGHDKGGAVRQLIALYRRKYASVVVVGLGNSANDLSLLRETDIAFLVRNPDGHWDTEVIEHLPNVERSHAIGPQGWREAVDQVIDRFAA